MRWALIALVGIGCGRVAFDPIDPSGDGSGSGNPDGNTTGSGDGSTVNPDGAIDALDLCVFATTVSVGTTAPIDTCSGMDRADFCSTGKREVVFKFVVPANANYTYRAFDAGSTNINNTTARLNTTCTARTGACSGSVTTPFTGGQTLYFAVEASQAACAMIQLDIVMN